MSIHPDLEPWIAELAPRLGLRPDEVPVQFLLDVARDVAHGAVRPGAPVSAFMIGLALGRADIATTDDAQRAVDESLEAWASRENTGGADGEAQAGADGEAQAGADEDAVTREPDEPVAHADAVGIGGDDDVSIA